MPDAWPPSLPQKQQLGVSMQPVDYAIESENDTGPPNVRNRYSPAREVYRANVPITLTGEQYATLRAFYRAIGGRAGTFTWDDPADDTAVVFRFLTPPNFVMVRGGIPGTRVWVGALELESVPDVEP